MTQEVQPLTWSKRTNIEEHQQFFSKINEIIGNLAPTVDEAEQAIAQATAAIASANDAVATANAASDAASAAASQAQTAASTVAGYDTRLTAAEGGIDSLQAADAQNVKIDHINEYAIGLTGNQNSTGTKGFKAIKTPFLEIANNFRPVVYYGGYDPTDMQIAERVRVITVFPSVDKKESPVFRVETFEDATTIGVDISNTVYGGGVNQSITMRVRKSDGMGYVTVPSRGSANVSDYHPGEVVTINTLKQLGLIQ